LQTHPGASTEQRESIAERGALALRKAGGSYRESAAKNETSSWLRLTEARFVAAGGFQIRENGGALFPSPSPLAPMGTWCCRAGGTTRAVRPVTVRGPRLPRACR